MRQQLFCPESMVIMTAGPLAKWRKSMCSMQLRLYKSASVTLTSNRRSLEESTWDNSRHPMMAFPRSGRGKSQPHQDQVTSGNVPFLHGNAMSAPVRHVKDFVMTKKCLAGQLVVRKRPASRVLAFSFSTQDIYVSPGRPSAKRQKGINCG